MTWQSRRCHDVPVRLSHGSRWLAPSLRRGPEILLAGELIKVEGLTFGCHTHLPAEARHTDAVARVGTNQPHLDPVLEEPGAQRASLRQAAGIGQAADG